mmetsp:Transcript_2489/g.2608  ORF Transcript_2489/g.2608 Transcript_2489/m.2608 type:complete len:152 (+) Transcript_2489:118-573(+)
MSSKISKQHHQSDTLCENGLQGSHFHANGFKFRPRAASESIPIHKLIKKPRSDVIQTGKENSLMHGCPVSLSEVNVSASVFNAEAILDIFKPEYDLEGKIDQFLKQENVASSSVKDFLDGEMRSKRSKSFSLMGMTQSKLMARRRRMSSTV